MRTVIGDDMRESIEGGALLEACAAAEVTRSQLLAAARHTLAALSRGDKDGIRLARRLILAVLHALRLQATDPPRLILGQMSQGAIGALVIGVDAGDGLHTVIVTAELVADLRERVNGSTMRAAEALYWLDEHVPDWLSDLDAMGVSRVTIADMLLRVL